MTMKDLSQETRNRGILSLWIMKQPLATISDIEQKDKQEISMVYPLEVQTCYSQQNLMRILVVKNEHMAYIHRSQSFRTLLLNYYYPKSKVVRYKKFSLLICKGIDSLILSINTIVLTWSPSFSLYTSQTTSLVL